LVYIQHSLQVSIIHISNHKRILSVFNNIL
jgi:hypothetical protein